MAAYTEIFIDQNSDFTVTVSLTDVNGDPVSLVGKTLEGKFKKSFDSETQYTLNVYTLSAGSGNVYVDLAAADSANVEPGKYMFSVNMSDANTNSRILQGTLTLNPSVL